MRAEAIKKLGGVCARCGTAGSKENPLEFHHKVPEHSKNSYQRLKDALRNPQKFVLLCKMDHKNLHVEKMKKTGRIDPDSFMDVKAARALASKPTPTKANYEREASLRLHFGKGSHDEGDQSTAVDDGEQGESE